MRIRMGAASNSTVKLRNQNTLAAEGANPLTPKHPGDAEIRQCSDGLTFRRTIAIDDRYLFTIKDEVTTSQCAVTLYPSH